MIIDNFIWDITLNIVNKNYDTKKGGSIESYTLMSYYFILRDYKENTSKYSKIICEIRKDKINKIYESR